MIVPWLHQQIRFGLLRLLHGAIIAWCNNRNNPQQSVRQSDYCFDYCRLLRLLDGLLLGLLHGLLLFTLIIPIIEEDYLDYCFCIIWIVCP